MMYWIVFALFTCAETFTDVFLSWFPFYYEIKIILVIWLLSPATKGSSILYRKFVHPTLSSREQEIDEYINKAKEQSYKQVLDIGSKGMSAIMQTAIKGGGGLVNQLRKSYSLSDLSDPSHDDVNDEVDTITEPHLTRRRRSPHRSSSTSVVYFSEVDVRPDRVASIQSAEDISSSGYSSGEGLPLKITAREGLPRTGSLTRSRSTRVTRSTVPKKSGVSDESDENEEFDTNVVFRKDSDSSSENEFLDCLEVVHDDLDDGLNNLDTPSKDQQFLTACEENKVTKYESCRDNYNILDDKVLNIENNPTILEITKDVESFSTFLHNLIETKNETEIRKEEKVILPDVRSGKYNKKRAPLPPPSNSTLAEATSASCQLEPTRSIKATLILKPGVVKSFGSDESI
ncbi:receptor expression-enhancing protein 4 isoform X2 [Diorhabda carinulata]|nr:receptor expression-enhancing protein 4 isoform X2 [Diorhabda carinulata]